MQPDTLHLCIIGSKGRMGNLFKTLWTGEVEQIYELDLEPGKTQLSDKQIEAVVPKSDVVVFSVPIHKLEEAMQSVLPYLPLKCILTDLSSVKILPMQIMEKNYNGSVIGAHPLFGPECMKASDNNVDSMENRFAQNELSDTIKNVALVPGKNANDDSVRLITALFERADCNPFITTAEDHDTAMATIQGLNFISNLAYFSMRTALPELDKFITPSFKRRLYAAKSMLVEESELFINIVKHNPQIRESLQNYTNTLEDIVKLEDKSLGEMLALARQYFKP